MSTYVCYHIPSDRDDEEHPNAFAIPKPAEEVTLRDIRQAFPVPGDYHFRFKVKMETGSYWIDFTEGNSCVPTWGSRRIIAKVLRLSWQQKHVAAAPKTTSPPERPSVPRSVVSNHVDLFGGASPPRNATNGVTELDLFS
jgi:hypothetical protein